MRIYRPAYLSMTAMALALLLALDGWTGSSDARSLRPQGWTREGDLGPMPTPVTGAYPLSDQDNRGH